MEIDEDMPNKPWIRSVIRNTNIFSVRIGPSGGRKGFSALTSEYSTYLLFIGTHSMVWTVKVICWVLGYPVIASSEIYWCKSDNDFHGWSELEHCFIGLLLPASGKSEKSERNLFWVWDNQGRKFAVLKIAAFLFPRWSSGSYLQNYYTFIGFDKSKISQFF